MSATMDPDTESLLVSTCQALGGFEDRSDSMDDVSQVYVMGDECLECLKDIKKFIKYFEEPGDNVVLNFLGKMGVLEKDLIPIMLLNAPTDNSTKERLVLACIELMVPMTWIIDIKALQEMTVMEEDSSIIGNLHARTEILRSYKRAFLQPGVLNAVFMILLKPLEVEHRNLVAIPDASSSVTGTMEQFISSVMQEELLRRYQDENILALLITLASSAGDAQLTEWNTMALEVFYYIFMGVEPDDLIPVSTGTAKNPQLQDLLKKEQQAKASQSSAGRRRHDRFGTTGEVRLQEAGEYKKNVSKSGAVLLRNLAMNMLDSCFNQSGRERVKEHHRGQYLYLMAFLLKYQRQYADYMVRQYYEQKSKLTDRQLVDLKREYKENMKQCNFGLIGAAVQVQSEWDDVRRAMNCFQEILMTLYAMSKSGDEAYKEASSSVQNNIYYEGATLELFLDLARNFGLQSKKYLYTLARMIHILLKTLESYSKSTDFMYIRKKRAVPKKKKAIQAVDGNREEGQEGTDGAIDSQLSLGGEANEQLQEQDRDEDDEDDTEDEQPTHTMREHTFLFSEYERRFATESVVRTYCTLLEDYAELNEGELHWVASMFHRIAVNCHNLSVFYKLSTLQLFHQVLQANTEESKKDLIPLVNYIVHQFFKKLQEYPPLIVEVLFPKTSKSCLVINVGQEAADQQQEALSANKEKSLENTELQIDQSQPVSTQIRIAVLALMDEEKEDL
ncbi:Topoisomerase 1-associated factor 1, partial [Podila epigama]